MNDFPFSITEFLILVTQLNHFGVMHYVSSFDYPGGGIELRVQCEDWYCMISSRSEGHERGLLELHVGESSKGNLTARDIMSCLEFWPGSWRINFWSPRPVLPIPRHIGNFFRQKWPLAENLAFPEIYGQIVIISYPQKSNIKKTIFRFPRGTPLHRALALVAFMANLFPLNMLDASRPGLVIIFSMSKTLKIGLGCQFLRSFLL